VSARIVYGAGPKFLTSGVDTNSASRSENGSVTIAVAAAMNEARLEYLMIAACVGAGAVNSHAEHHVAAENRYHRKARVIIGPSGSEP
jgi:hypothetical protein